MKKSSHRNERAKKLLAGKGTGVSGGHKVEAIKKPGIGLSGAAPTIFPVKGNSPRKRLDKRRRFASGGAVDDGVPKKKGSAKTEVNIVIAGKGDQSPMPVPVPAALAGAPPASAMPPRPVPPMPMRPPGAMKRGGAVHMTAGSGGGEGRLQKVAIQKSDRKKDGK